ncbi:MAG: DUF4150 domain-containing protein [Proteobacteria bacterium]|nr:DUF4150 domain-containing protein [Pseudomonadota bacterium]
MSATVAVNKRTVVHKKSDGTSVAFPDICLTQCGPPVVPIPYPNIGKSSDLDNGAQTVTADGQPMGHEKSFFSKTTGDEAGDKKGVASGTTGAKAEFVSFSFDVFVEGKSVVRANDLMIHNNKNTPPTPLMQPPLVQEIVEETPEIPEQGKVTVKFIDPFGEPMQGLPVETEVDGEKKTARTMSRGQIIHVLDKDQVDITLDHKDFGLEQNNMGFQEPKNHG